MKGALTFCKARESQGGHRQQNSCVFEAGDWRISWSLSHAAPGVSAENKLPWARGPWWSFIQGNWSVSWSHGPKEGGSSVAGTGPAQKLEGRRDPEGSHWGCGQGTFGCEVDRHLQSDSHRRQSLRWAQEFSMWLRISLVSLSLFQVISPVK